MLLIEDYLLTAGTPQLCQQHLYVGETAGRLYVWTNSHGQSHPSSLQGSSNEIWSKHNTSPI